MCTRVLWNTNNYAVVSGRTMDWPTSTEPKLVIFPRGRRRDGGMLGDQRVIADNAAQWESKYGSVAVSVFGVGTVDGINEKGLAAHALYLKSIQLPPRDTSKQALHIGLWAQYLLDNAATVAEALKLMENIDLVMVEARGVKATLHLAIEDKTGDSAILEYIDGKLQVHHGREFTIMTNDPSYDEQLALLAKQDYSHPSRDMPLPGNVNAVDRFQRAAYYSALLPEPTNMQEAIASILAVMRNVSVPFGAPYGEFGVYNSEYRTAADLTYGYYFFELTNSPNTVWVNLSEINFKDGQTRQLDPANMSLAGDVTNRFEISPVAY